MLYNKRVYRKHDELSRSYVYILYYVLIHTIPTIIYNIYYNIYHVPT